MITYPRELVNGFFPFFYVKNRDNLDFFSLCDILLFEVIAVSESICRFIPSQNSIGNIKTIYFVYETDFATLKQPFMHPIYYVHLVTSGTAVLTMCDKKYILEAGCVFFTFPAVAFSLSGSADFKYMYISYTGAGAGAMLEELKITLKSPVYRDFIHVTEFWMSSISRVNDLNANMLSLSVLYYTLSFINQGDTVPEKRDSEVFLMIEDYISTHYRDSELSLKKLSEIFAYTEKYISYLFKREMNTGFKQYLTELRMQYAREMMKKGEKSIVCIAAECGYSDSLYFSRIFKKRMGITPTEYIKNGL